MATKTYSEAAQAVLFKAARDMRKVAASVLDDVTNSVELRSERTHEWAKSTARLYAELANELEERGHERCYTEARLEVGLFKSRQAYSAAIDAYEERRKSAAFLHEGAAL